MKIGSELELLLEKDGKPLEWKDWPALLDAARRVSDKRAHTKTDILTGEQLGIEIPGVGVISCDSSASQAELAAEPKEGKRELLSTLRLLYDLLEDAVKSIGGTVRWGSQYPGRIREEDYWKRVARKGMYTIARREWGWKHYEMHLSAAFQPAIDIDPANVAGYLNAIYAASPLAIAWFGGSAPSRGNAGELYYEYRMHGWYRMLPNKPSELEILGVRRFSDGNDYLDTLLGLRARTVALTGDYKGGQIAYFDSDVTGQDVVAGAKAHKITEIVDFRKDEIRTTDVSLSGKELINQMDWWTFWDARWRFRKDESGKFDKSYIEVRNMGTPSSYEKLEPIIDFFIGLRKEYEEVNALAEKYAVWKNIDEAWTEAIRYGKLPRNHMEFLESLRNNNVIVGNRLHGSGMQGGMP